jgi:hypothetical protein
LKEKPEFLLLKKGLLIGKTEDKKTQHLAFPEKSSYGKSFYGFRQNPKEKPYDITTLTYYL